MAKAKPVTQPDVIEVPFGEPLPSGYYYNRFRCTNCSQTEVRGILKGIRAITASIECPNCGCEVRG